MSLHVPVLVIITSLVSGSDTVRIWCIIIVPNTVYMPMWVKFFEIKILNFFP